MADFPEELAVIEKLVGLSVDLHRLNAGAQRHHDLSIVQWLVLKKILDQPGLSAKTLAEISGIHPSTLTPTLGRLEAMGLIFIQERSSDLRRKLLLATWKGLEWSRKSEEVFIQAVRRLPTSVAVERECDNVRHLTQELLGTIFQEKVKDNQERGS